MGILEGGKRDTRSQTKGLWVTACALIALTILAPAQANSDRGPAFTSPDDKQSLMPPGWSKQPVRHATKNHSADLVVSLDQQMFPMFEPVIRQYAAKHGLDIHVRAGTCGISSGLLLRKQIDIGGYCCPPGKNDRLPGLTFHTIGIASLALITHPDSPVNNLTLAQARSIYRGHARNWPSVGKGASSGNLIQPVGRLHCKTRPGHWRLLLKNQDKFSTRLREVGAIPDMVSQVAGLKDAIGYESLWMLQQYQKRGRTKVLTIDGIRPNNKPALLKGRYPIYRTYSMTTWETGPASSEIAKRLVQHLIEQGNRIDPKYGLVTARELRNAGWHFRGDELIAEPKRATQAKRD